MLHDSKGETTDEPDNGSHAQVQIQKSALPPSNSLIEAKSSNSLIETDSAEFPSSASTIVDPLAHPLLPKILTRSASSNFSAQIGKQGKSASFRMKPPRKQSHSLAVRSSPAIAPSSLSTRCQPSTACSDSTPFSIAVIALGGAVLLTGLAFSIYGVVTATEDKSDNVDAWNRQPVLINGILATCNDTMNGICSFSDNICMPTETCDPPDEVCQVMLAEILKYCGWLRNCSMGGIYTFSFGLFIYCCCLSPSCYLSNDSKSLPPASDTPPATAAPTVDCSGTREKIYHFCSRITLLCRRNTTSAAPADSAARADDEEMQPASSFSRKGKALN